MDNIKGPGDFDPPDDDGYDDFFERRSEELFNQYRADRERVDDTICGIKTSGPLADLLLSPADLVEIKMDEFVFMLGEEVNARIRLAANEATQAEWDAGPVGDDGVDGGDDDA